MNDPSTGDKGPMHSQPEWCRVALASIGDAVITTDTEGRVTFLNPVAESLTGWTLDEATGISLESVFKIVNQETRRTVESPTVRALRDGVIVGLANHTVLIAKGGTERPIDDSAAPILCKEGEVVGCVLVFRDVTERQQRFAAARLLASIVESSTDAIISKSLDGIIQSWNPASERLFGYTAEQAVGRHISFLIPADRTDEEDWIITRLRAGERVEPYDTVRIRNDGQPVHVSLTISPVKDAEGRIVRASKIIRDITGRKQAEETIRKSEVRFRLAVEAAPNGMLMVREDGTITLANVHAKKMFGYASGELVGQSVEQLVPERFRLGHSSHRGGFFAAPRPRAMGTGNELYGLRKDGGEFSIEIGLNPITTEEGLCVLACVIDTTERRQRSQEFLLSVLANAVDAIITLDERGIILSFNEQAEKLFGYSSSEVVGHNVKILMPEPHHSKHDGYLSRYLHTGQAKIIGIGREVEGRRKDGSTFPMDLGVSEFLLGERHYFTGVVRDITESKRQANELRQLAADLSEADRRKDEFLATLAHELRNPLAPIRNGLQLMKLASGQAATVEQTRSMMERQLTQLVRLVDDLMDVSRISRDKLELRKGRVPLAAVLNSAVETSRPLIEQMGHELTVTLPKQPLIVDADMTRLAQVFLNLLNNAAKYCDRGGHIQLNVERQGSDVVVTVKDTGIGIAADQLPRIFEIFTQVDRSLEKSQGGLGIGLTLVKRLVEMHGGSVEARSEGVGKGSEFVVRLPVVIEASKPQESGGVAEQPVRSSHRILVVDDNRDGADSLSEMLKIMGNDTRTAYDGQEGVDVAGEFRPDVVLLDIGLPKLNGYEACRRIREQPWGKGVVLIAVTGWGQDDDRRRSHEAGFDHHMVKPVDPQALMKMLAGLQVAKK